ncbi:MULTISPECIES: biopolymer transporter ExbD [unclassified Variovorax]|uniref:ExbD/TolR family protein n=1 Tax=unclassified Variovorax TaxID=663243 RepID=UPI00076DE0A2|nr:MULTISPECIES: biopolymer transporter ExbD [unclassified Variovorax]KWT98418.1 Biopolymer transport protein [Variovorax sp. WDL1]PNG49913.1 Biopolymer transport protein ExbD [Variovorax sp. B2]PNG50785.1 Biopolymer transport protein ExbD [Variovorax sp. B4]VTV18003.1 Biopolymer transport protein ExbD [Variovorax sp. WDL1]
MTANRKQLAAINVTPLVDVLLILLVIMMLAMPMFVKKLPVDLPQTSLSGTPSVAQSLSVSLQADGSLMLDSNPTTLQQLKARITPTVSVELSVDRATTYEQIAMVISELQAAAPKDIALMTR